MTTPPQLPQPESPRPASGDNQNPQLGNAEDVSWAELTAQAAHLRRLADRLDQLTAEVDDLRRRGDEIDAVAADIHHTLQQHHAQQPVGPPNWATMDTGPAARAWRDLTDWIDQTFVPWYDITRDQLPDCWALHRPVVVELSWLRHTHTAAHEPGAPVHLVADWHTHWKPAALKHIHDVVPRHGLRACGPGHHLATSTDRTPHTPPVQPHPSANRPPLVPTMPTHAVTEQLAHREHWHNFYTQAVTHDLANRPDHRE